MSSPSPTSAARGGGTPEWLVNLSALGWRVLVVAVLLGVVFAGATRLITITASVLLALLIAASFEPLMTSLRARGWSVAKAAALVTTAVVGVVTLAVIVMVPAFVPFIAQAFRQVNAGLDAAQSGLSGGPLPSDATAALSDAIASIKKAVSAVPDGIGASIATMVTVAILAAILTFFFLRDGLRALVQIVPRGTPHRRTIVGLVGRTAIPSAGRYLRIAGAFATIDATMTFVFLAVLGVPLAAPLAVLVFLAGFVPYLGLPVAASVLALATLATNGSRDAAILLALMAGMYWITRRQLRPYLRQQATGLNPATILISVLVASALGGYVGMVAVVPAILIARAAVGAMVLVLDPGPRMTRTFLVPGWLDRLADLSWRLLVTAALIAFALAVLGAFPIVMLPLVIAAVLAATLAPLVSVLVARGWSTFRAALAATAGSALVVATVMALAVASLLTQGTRVVETATDGAEQADSSGILGATVGAFGSGITAATAGISVAVTGALVVIVLSALLCFYLLRDGANQWRAIIAHLPSATRPQLTAVASDATSVVSRYMVGTGAIAAFGAGTQWAIMVILGLPLALPLAVLSFFGGFVPYIGSFITTGLAFLVTVAVGSPFDILVMLIFTLVFNIVTGNVIAPIVYSRAVNLHPAIVLLAIPAGNEIAGILGMFLAVPVIGIVVATWRPILNLVGTMPPALREPEPVAAVEIAAQGAGSAAGAPAGGDVTATDHDDDDPSEEHGIRGFLRRTVLRHGRGTTKP